jgi:hypothetical protein
MAFNILAPQKTVMNESCCLASELQELAAAAPAPGMIEMIPGGLPV